MGRCSAAVLVALVVMAASGCGLRNDAATSGSPSSSSIPGSLTAVATRAPTPTELAATPSERAEELPPGFPVMPHAEPALLPDDPSVVARWTVSEVGSGPYEWYLNALPVAGFEVVGTYPSERAALIRFRDTSGRTGQLLAELVDGRTRISVQEDRP